MSIAYNGSWLPENIVLVTNVTKATVCNKKGFYSVLLVKEFSFYLRTFLKSFKDCQTGIVSIAFILYNAYHYAKQ